MRRVALIASLGVALAGCGGAAWSSRASANFLNACEARGTSQRTCECAERGLEARWSESQLRSAEAAILRGGGLGALSVRQLDELASALERC